MLELPKLGSPLICYSPLNFALANDLGCWPRYGISILQLLCMLDHALDELLDDSAVSDVLGNGFSNGILNTGHQAVLDDEDDANQAIFDDEDDSCAASYSPGMSLLPVLDRLD